MLEGHNFDGAPLPDVPTVPMIMGSGALYSTPNDMLRWIAWHLDRSWHPDVEMHLLDHAAYVYRDGLDPVFGLDESGPMDALGLGWIIMMPRGDTRAEVSAHLLRSTNSASARRQQWLRP